MARVAILTAEYEPFRGGISTFVRELARAGVELGHEITVFAPNYLTDGSGSTQGGLAIKRYRAGAFSGRWYPAYLKAAVSASRGAFDQVLAADIAFLDSLALVFGATGQTFDAFVHGSELNRNRKSAKGRILAPFKVFQRPRTIFANSEFTRRLLLKNFPCVEPLRATVAPLGVSAQWFKPVEPGIARKRLALGTERIVACVGRITPRKGQLTLLQALAAPALDRPGLCAVIAGNPTARDADFAARLRAAAGKLKHSKALFVEDLTDEEVRSLYAAADIFCLPGSANTSAVEGFGLVYLEAAAQGTPSIASSVGGVPEVVVEGETGLLVGADDPAKLRTALLSLLDDDAMRQRLGMAAKLRAKEFSWRRCAEKVFGPVSGVQSQS